MLLTKKDLKEYLEARRVTIPESLVKELLKEYGSFTTDGEGHVFEYTEQDIYEQLRKKIYPYEKPLNEVRACSYLRS